MKTVGHADLSSYGAWTTVLPVKRLIRHPPAARLPDSSADQPRDCGAFFYGGTAPSEREGTPYQLL